MTVLDENMFYRIDAYAKSIWRYTANLISFLGEARLVAPVNIASLGARLSRFSMIGRSYLERDRRMSISGSTKGKAFAT